MANTNNSDGMLAVGTMLHGTFRIDRYLASGGFGNTYLATNVNFGEQYAVKEFFIRGVNERDDNSTTVSVSNTGNIGTFEAQKEKFKKEAIRLRKINNKHVVRVHDLFEDNGTEYYVMDYIDGTSLRDRMKNGTPIGEDEALDFFRQMVDALDAIHSIGIYHLDLKPANVMVKADGTAVLIDFGASKQLGSDGERSLSTGISYTNGYAPTEQVDYNLDKIGPWTDFYALGATLYNILTGKKPPMPSDIVDDVTPDKHLSLVFPAVVSHDMRALVVWLMQGQRMRRPQSAAEIYRYLDSHFKQQEDVTVFENGHKEEKEPEIKAVVSDDEPVARDDKQLASDDKPVVHHKPFLSRHRSNIIAVVAMLVLFVVSFFAIRAFMSHRKADSSKQNDTTAVKTSPQNDDERFAEATTIEDYSALAQRGYVKAYYPLAQKFFADGNLSAARWWAQKSISVGESVNESDALLKKIENDKVGIAVKNKDWTTLQQLADEGEKHAYAPLAEHCVSIRDYARADYYAQKAYKANVQRTRAISVMRMLRSRGYYKDKAEPDALSE